MLCASQRMAALVPPSGSAATAKNGLAPMPPMGASLNASKAETQIEGLIPLPVIESPATSIPIGRRRPASVIVKRTTPATTRMTGPGRFL